MAVVPIRNKFSTGVRSASHVKINKPKPKPLYTICYSFIYFT